MKTFNDNTGRSWTLSVTVGTIKRVRALCGVDLANIITLEAGKQPKVDLLERLASDPVLLEGIGHGEVEALIVQNPFEIGYRGVNLAADRLMGKKVARKNNVPSMVVDKQNLDDMKKRFPSALGL